MFRDGKLAVLGIDCGCYGRWLHWRELTEYEATGLL
jgi:hypothetical protein